MSLTQPAPRTGSTPAPTAHVQHHGAAHTSPSAPPEDGPRRSWAVIALVLAAQVLVFL
jgi:hypothetical protein